jgi:hypothetical protein
MSKFAERPEVIRGRAAEIAVSQWLQRRGWAVLPAYDYSGRDADKAPRMESTERPLVVPDLLAARKGATAWFEVKRKTHADLTRMTGRLETGIAWRLWDHYHDVRVRTGLPVWVVFVHDKEDELRACEIGEAEFAECNHGRSGRTIRFYGGDKMDRNGMVFFCWSCLVVIGRTSAVMAMAA